MGLWLTGILGEQDILGFEVSMDHLVAVQEDQAANNIQRNQVALATSNTRQTASAIKWPLLQHKTDSISDRALC